jgi:plastocyanin
MTARRAGELLVGAMLMAATWSLASSASAGDGPATLGIRNGSSEFSFSLTRSKVKPGFTIIQYQNTGEDPHDVKIQRNGSEDVLEIGETAPGGVSTLPTTKLKARSTYTFWCSLEGHREAGMEATLKVAKKKGNK